MLLSNYYAQRTAQRMANVKLIFSSVFRDTYSRQRHRTLANLSFFSINTQPINFYISFYINFYSLNQKYNLKLNH